MAADSDGDCRADGVEDANGNGRVDAGEGDPNAADSDGDGLLDRVEDANCNGRADAGETSAADADSDDDGLRDGVEVADGLDPLEPDSDGDGVPDGVDVNPGQADPDSDGDGLPDSVDAAPSDPDRDDDGLTDGQEDANRNGLVDAPETDPSRADTDGDGLDDAAERAANTNPRLADSDGDLLTDGVEVTRTRTDPNDRDSDDDGLSDGLEDRNGDGVVGPANPAGQETDPRDADTDDDGIIDGAEDRNRNGRVDAGETDPRVGDRDGDNDGLSDQQEAALGTNPAVADTDGDGIDDGDEVTTTGTDPRLADTDGDGVTDGVETSTGTNPLRADTDGDGIVDGVEDADRDGVRDPTETDPRDADTDDDGVIDGAEDGNQNGRVDPGELNPLDPADVVGSPSVGAACGAPITPGLFARSEADVLLALAPSLGGAGFAAGDVRPVVRGGQTVGSSAVDRGKNIFAFAVRTTPAATAQAQLTTIENGLGADLSLPLTQNFTTWDGFEAARGTYNLDSVALTATRLTQVARLALGLAPTETFDLDFAQANGEAGAVKLGLVVVRRSATTAIVIGVATSLAQFGNATSGRDFRLEDLAGGTALGQVGDAIGTQCDVKAAQADVPVDFLWVIDNSGSMGDEINAVGQAVADFSAAIANTDLDTRVAVTTTEFQYRTAGPTFSNADDVTGECVFDGTTLGPAYQIGPTTFVPATRICACAFTGPTEGAAFSSCIQEIRRFDSFCQRFTGNNTQCTNQGCLVSNNECVARELGGSGAEGGYAAAQEFLSSVLTSSSSPPRRKLRPEAKVVTLFISDAGEQSTATDTTRIPYLPSSAFSGRSLSPDETTALATSVQFWSDFFAPPAGAAASAGWDPTRVGEPPMILAGILCPLATQVKLNAQGQPVRANGCNGEEDNTGVEVPSFDANGVGSQRFGIRRYYDVINQLAGLTGSIADTVGDGFQGPDLANISATIEAILRAVVTGTSPYQLSKAPISSTVKVALEQPTVGACNVADVPRVTDLNGDGFLYDAATNRIAFVGDCRPAGTGTDVVASYRTWIDLTGDPDGAPPPCGGDCPDPLVCVNDQCVCPSDCGQAGGLDAGQTCDTTTDGDGDGYPDCAVECLPDCGGCAPGSVCDTAACACECPADCNFGGELPEGFVCNPATCQAECAPDRCVGDDPGGNFVCGANCVYECPDDCGGGLGANERCNPATCEPECAPDCNANCDGYTTCNSATCGCECVENATCSPGFAFDPVACTCVCDAAALACPATHNVNLDDCSCDCAPQCNGTCLGGLVCDPGRCECLGVEG
ncbi:MAG: hypothetical protein FJ137_02685 [Deltaproteobacteria bacterium]|nr:hypothetical protein [Deltaproteobacteria bacterium]